jgi:hypothetical protein
MQMLRPVSALTTLLLLFTFNRAAGQAQSTAPQLPACAWNCYKVVLPYGLYVREVADDGAFVILEDGSVWEIRLPQRPVTSSWRPGDFVQLRNIAAPVLNFDILLSHGDYDRAEARLAGRGQAPVSGLPE